nr:hypothetical protein [Tanacetum cinerariifolium]
MVPALATVEQPPRKDPHMECFKIVPQSEHKYRTMDMTIDQQVALGEALVAYDVLRLTPFYKAFLVIVDVPEIYMQEFWVAATVHHHSIRFKMNNKKCIVNLEYFMEMLHICPRLPNQTFDELPFKEEILAFLRYLGHSGEIKKITDVNINKLHQPWRSFAAVINKCLSRKSTGYDSLRLSQAQILWGMYHKKNIDFAYLLWEDFLYQFEHKDAKKSNEMYYPRFTKVIINFFMTKDPSIPRRNKVNWHYVRDDQMFTTIKLILRQQNTQQFGAMLPVELTNEDIKNSVAYKEYYDIASGEAPPKTKASVRKTQSSFDTTLPPPTATGTRFSTSAKGKQPAKSSKAKGLSVLSEVALTEAEQIKLATKRSLDEDDDDDVDDQSEADDDEDEQDDDDQDDDQDSDNDDDDFVHPKLSTHDEEAKDEESFDPIVQTPSHMEDSDDESNDDKSIDSLFESTPRVDVPVTTTVVPLLVTAPTLHPLSIPVMSQVQQAPAPIPTTVPSTSLQDLLNFGSLFRFDHRLKTLEANFSKLMQINQFAKAVSSIPRIIDRYIDHRINEAVIVAVQLHQGASKVQVSKILSKIKRTVNEQLEAEVLTRSSNSSKTSYAVAADLSEMELKKILIEKMESNKSIHRSDEQRNLYKALVDAYEYRGYKRRREGKEPESTNSPKEKHPRPLKQTKPPTPDRAWNKTLPATHESIQPWISDLAKQADSCTSFNELMDALVDFSAFLMNRLTVDTLTPELQAGPTYEMMKGSCKSLIVVWHDYKNLDWITVRRDDDKLYKFKERDFKRLHIQDIEDMLLLLVKGKLTNLTVEERFAFNVYLRMFTRSIVIQRRVEDLQLGVEGYQKKLNLTKPDMYRTDLKRKEAYIAYSNPRGFIYQNKDKQNRLMRIDELHRFSDGALNDVRTTLDDRLKGIRMKYLP